MPPSRTARGAAALAVCAFLSCSDATGPSGIVTPSRPSRTMTGIAMS